jgi:hypothetical protein
MKTFLNILKTLGFIVIYFIVIALVGKILPSPVDVKPDASAFLALLLHLGVNSFFIIYLLKRLSLKGIRLIAVTALSVYGLQIFMTQIETWIFIKAFPQITPELLTNIFLSNLINIVAMTLVGYLLWKPSASTEIVNKPTFNRREKLGKLAVLSVLYMVLYFTFGYLVPWQLAEAREFYRSSTTSIGNTTLAFIQIVRGSMWVLFCLPVLFNLKGGKIEKFVIITLMMALLPTILLLMPNPFMPFTIRMAHFAEVFMSNGIFGVCIVWLMTNKQNSVK